MTANSSGMCPVSIAPRGSDASLGSHAISIVMNCTATIYGASWLGYTQQMVTTLHDADLERRIERDGYAVVDLLDAETVGRLLDAYELLDSGISEGYYPSLMSSDASYKGQTHDTVVREVWPKMSAFLNDYVPLLGVFMVKHPGPDTDVPPHQDWIVAPEDDRPTMNVWTPLTPIDEATGPMAVLPGSHRYLEGLRGSPTFPTQWNAVHEQVRTDLMEPVHLDVGQAMLYDIRVLHGTPSNRSNQTRVVTSLYAIPNGSQTIHYYRDPNSGSVGGYEVPSDFCTTFKIGEVPDGEPFVQYPDYQVEELTFADIEARYRASDAFAARVLAG